MAANRLLIGRLAAPANDKPAGRLGAGVHDGLIVPGAANNNKVKEVDTYAAHLPAASKLARTAPSSGQVQLTLTK